MEARTSERTIPGYNSSMGKRPKGPFVPPERHETVRQRIVGVLEGKTLSAREISAEAKLPEKEVYEHLTHIRRQLARSDHPLKVVPAECRKCGFVFSKRDRLNKPGRCPVCRSEAIQEPYFSIPEEGRGR